MALDRSALVHEAFRVRKWRQIASPNITSMWMPTYQSERSYFSAIWMPSKSGIPGTTTRSSCSLFRGTS